MHDFDLSEGVFFFFFFLLLLCLISFRFFMQIVVDQEARGVYYKEFILSSKNKF